MVSLGKILLHLLNLEADFGQPNIAAGVLDGIPDGQHIIFRDVDFRAVKIERLKSPIEKFRHKVVPQIVRSKEW